MNKYQAKIDISNNIEVYFDVPLFTGDIGNTVELDFFCGGEPYPMDDVLVTACRADGAVVFDAGSMEGNTAVFTMKNNVHSQPGQLEVQVALSNDEGDLLTSGVLHFDVLDGYKETSGIEADDRLPVLNEVVQNAFVQANYAKEMGDYARDNANQIADELGYYANLSYYRVEVDPENPNPDTAVTYADVPHGAVPGISYWKDQFPFSDIEVWTVKDGVPNYQLSPDDYTKKLDGLQLLETLDPDSAAVQNAFTPAETTVCRFYDEWLKSPSSFSSNAQISEQGWAQGRINVSTTATEGESAVGTKYFVLNPDSSIPSIYLTYNQITIPKTGLYTIALHNPMKDGFGSDGQYIYNAVNGMIDISDKNGTVYHASFDFSQNLGWCSLGTFEIDASEPITVTFTNNEIKNMRIDALSFTDAVNADITTGEDGDVMVKIPKMYYKFENLDNGKQSFTICNKKGDDSFVSTAFDTADGSTQDCFWIGAYEGSIADGKLRSLSGKTPDTSKTISQFRTCANENGVGYGLEEIHKTWLLDALFVLMFKSLDKLALGVGAPSSSGPAVTGTANTKGLYYGSPDPEAIKFCGIENFFGSMFKYQDGIFHQVSNGAYGRILMATSGFNDTAEGYTDVTQAPSSGYISKMHFTNQIPFLPSEVNASETTYYCAGFNSMYNQTGLLALGACEVSPFRYFFRHKPTQLGTGLPTGARLLLNGGMI